MRKLMTVALLLLAPLALSAGFKKAYFAATKVGSWAKYSMHSMSTAAADAPSPCTS